MSSTRSTVFQAGMEEGRKQIREEVVVFLKKRLVDDKDVRPERGSEDYVAGMDLTRELLVHIESVELK